MQTKLPRGDSALSSLLRQTEAEKGENRKISRLKSNIGLDTSARNVGLKRVKTGRERRFVTRFRGFFAVARLIAVFKKQ
jgi:hypothetical protein